MAAIEEVDFEFMKKFVFCMVDRIYCDQIEPLLNKFTAKEIKQINLIKKRRN